jgi:hypothetical protein
MVSCFAFCMLIFLPNYLITMATQPKSGVQSSIHKRPSHFRGNEDDSRQDSSPFSVIGIALVVDQRGKGARMVLRYPTSPVQLEDEDIFFRLESRQMAKLFRPKPSLCGQPMTLSVGGTVFCCRAVLMQDDVLGSSNPAPEVFEDGHDDSDDLVLFSVVVALAPQIKTTSLPITGWFESNAREKMKQHRQSQIHKSLSMLEGKFAASSHGGKASASFLSIRRVHVSLTRLCRALEREERRCRYVSLQANLFHQLRHDLYKKYQHVKTSKPQTTAAAVSPVSMTSKTLPNDRSNAMRHRRSNSFISVPYDHRSETTMSLRNHITSAANACAEADKDLDAVEKEQELLEIMVAANPPAHSDTGFAHQGNLARELLQTYHALARNNDFPPTALDILTSREAIVYVNRHVAVAIESVRLIHNLSCDTKFVVRPFETLLFPYSSPSQLLESMLGGVKGNPGTMPHRLQQLLLRMNPQKPLSEIAMEASVPLQTATEIATHLVGQGACVVSPILSPSCWLACVHVDQIHSSGLAFSHHFGPEVPIFLVVSVLTDAERTLGESLKLVSSSGARRTSSCPARILSECIRNSLPHRVSLVSSVPTSDISPVVAGTYGDGSVDTIGQERRREMEEVEKRLFRMATWLRAHKVLVHLQEFLISVPPSSQHSESKETKPEKEDHENEKKVDSGARPVEPLADDLLYQELEDTDCLQGQISLQECAWRLGFEITKLRMMAQRHDRIRIVIRIAEIGDDQHDDA